MAVADVEPRLAEADGSSDPEALDAMFRMPVEFGPAAGPRNVPRGRQHIRYVHRRAALTVTALSDRSALQELLPPGCTHAGEPLISVTVTNLTNLAWLAGRGYNIVLMQILNVECKRASETVKGIFIPVLWESLAEPIITGREELGMPKLYADIPDHATVDDAVCCSASWQGFRWFELDARELRAAPSPSSSPQPLFSHKYIPATGNWGAADVDYLTISGRDPTEPSTLLEEHLEGTGKFGFTRARWEDLPTQFTIVNRLCDLPLHEFRGATLKVTSQGTVDTRGGGNLFGQQVLAR